MATITIDDFRKIVDETGRSPGDVYRQLKAQQLTIAWEEEYDKKLTQDRSTEKATELGEQTSWFFSKVKEPPKTVKKLGSLIAWWLQWLSDIWQWTLWKVIEVWGRELLRWFWFDENLVQQFTTRWEHPAFTKGEEEAPWFSGAGREVGKIAGSMLMTAWVPSWPIMSGKKWFDLLLTMAKRMGIRGAEFAADAAVYNLASEGNTENNVNPLLAWGIGMMVGWPIPLIWSRIVAPYIDNLANKLQLSWLMNTSKFERLQEILQQWGSDDLAKWEIEDVANWMFQRDVKWTRPQIVQKLQDIWNFAMDALNSVLRKSSTRYKPKNVDGVLNALRSEYTESISEAWQKNMEMIDLYIKQYNEWGLTLRQLNDIKQRVYRDLNPYTSSWKVKLSKADIAAANSEIKTFIEKTAVEEGIVPDGMDVRLLNNEFAMADSMQKAIQHKETSATLSDFLNAFTSRWWGSIIWWLAWLEVWWPFDEKTVAWKVGNALFGMAVGRFVSSTQAKTWTASVLKWMSWSETAQILKLMKKNVNDLTDVEKKQLEKVFSNMPLWDDTLNYGDDLSNLGSSKPIRNKFDEWMNANPLLDEWGRIKSSTTNNPAQVRGIPWEDFSQVGAAKSTTDDLLQEAKKYKSADEFVESKATLYHWTNNEIVWWLKAGDSWMIYATDNIWYASSQWKPNKIAIIWNNELTDKSLLNINKQTLDDAIQKSLEGRRLELYLDRKDELLNRAFGQIKDYVEWRIDLQDLFGWGLWWTKTINNLWFDFMSYKNPYWDWKFYVTFTDDAVKTEAQLRKIREEANK